MPDDLEKQLKELELEKLRTEIHSLKKERKVPVPLSAGYVGVYAGFLGSIIAIVTFLVPYWDNLKKQETDKIEKLITQLDQSEKREEERYAVVALSRYEKKAIPMLQDAYDRYRSTRTGKNIVRVWRVMARDGVKEVIPPLLGALKDPDPEARDLAQQGLVSLGRKAIKPLFKALEQESYLRAQRDIATTLWKISDNIKDKSVEKELLLYLAKLPKPPTVTQEPLEALGSRQRVAMETEPQAQKELKTLGGIIPRNVSQPVGGGRYLWRIWLEAQEKTLSLIDRVVYKLPPTTNQPETERTNREEQFALTGEGWEEYEIKIEIHYTDGVVEVLRHWLDLGLPKAKKY